MLNVINGIIVDTFQQLREEGAVAQTRKNDVCFVCSLNRDIFEKKGLNFEEHKNQYHSMLNYVHYILKVRSSVKHDLNSIDFYVLNLIMQGRTDFLPVKKCLSLND